MATDQSLAIKLHQTLSPIYSEVYIAPKNNGESFQIVHYAGQVLYDIECFLEKNRDYLPNNVFYAVRYSNNQLVQELFQCKLTRKGTLAPSDRQSRLRKSLGGDTFSTSANAFIFSSSVHANMSSNLQTEGAHTVDDPMASNSISDISEKISPASTRSSNSIDFEYRRRSVNAMY